MLRTAQEIIDECFEKLGKEALIKEIYIMAVNTAVREAIEECADKATLQHYFRLEENNEMVNPTRLRTKEEEDTEYPGQFIAIDEQSILDLIHQIK